MPLNRKRRIFRGYAAPRRGTRAWPLVAIVTVAVATAAATGSMILQHASMPAFGAAGAQIQAEAGQSTVLDADTLRLGSQIVRLQGIAAPARGSICHGDSQTEYDCGSAAANALASLVRDASIDCTIQGHDRLGRPIGDCQAAGQPLSTQLVRNGWARATEASLRAAEREARAAQRGIWRPLGQT